MKQIDVPRKQVPALHVKGYLKCTLLLVSFYTLFHFCEKQTDGFSLSKIQSPMPFNPEWETAPGLDIASIHKILNQPFTYLGSGAQSYAFISADHKYVLKFFRPYRVQMAACVAKLALPAFLKKRALNTLAKRQDKWNQDCRSYLLAFTKLKKQTGVIDLHLNKSDHIYGRQKIFDKIGVALEVDLDQVAFVLQTRAEPFYPTLEKWIEEGQLHKAETALSSTLQLLIQRNLAGLFDKDANLLTNFGFNGENCVQFDPGRFQKQEGPLNLKIYKDEIIRIVDPLKSWLKIRCLPLADFLDNELNKLDADNQPI